MVPGEFVDPVYTKERYLLAYSHIIHAMPGESQWEKTDYTHPEPPKFIVQPGRPKKNRRREAGEQQPRKKIRISGPRNCSNCGQQGHYKNKCKNAKKGPSPPTISMNTGGRPKKPNRLIIGSQKRKYNKKVHADSSQAGGSQVGGSAGGSQGGSAGGSQGGSAGGSQVGSAGGSQGGSTLAFTPGACSQSNARKPYLPVRAPKKKVITSLNQLKQAVRRSPRKLSKDGSSVAP